MKRAIIYARVSTEDQAERYGIPSQLRACREYCERNDYEVSAEITDEGISGTTMDRAGLSRLREMVQSGAVDVVVIFDADRLSRELGHLLILKPEIERRAALEFVAAKFEDSPSGRMFFHMRGVIAQYERETTRERTMRGQRERAKSGLTVGGRVPFGYSYEGGRLIEGPRASTVRDIFRWYDTGGSLRGIAKRLRCDGIPTWGGRGWGFTSVRFLLANETYAGVAHWKGSDGSIPVSVPALIDRPTWERVQVRLAAKVNTGRPSSRYLLRSVLYCSCGRRMHGEHSRTDVYRCSGRNALRLSGEKCLRTVAAGKLDGLVWQSITDAIMSPSFVDSVLVQREAAMRASSPGRVDDLRAAHRKAKGREDAARQAMLDPDLTDARAEFRAEFVAARAERVRIEGEIQRIEQERQAEVSSREWIKDAASALRSYIPDLGTTEERRAFLSGLISRAEWDGEVLSLDYFLGAKLFSTPQRSVQFSGVQVNVKARLVRAA